MDTKRFIAQIFAQRGEPLEDAIVVARNIAATHRNELQLFRTFDQAMADHRAATHFIDLNDIRLLMSDLRSQSGMRDFKELVIRFAEDEIKEPREALLEVLSDVGLGDQSGRDQFQYTVRFVGQTIRRILPDVRDPQAVADALSAAHRNGAKAFGAAAGDYRALVDALQKRLEELRPTNP